MSTVGEGEREGERERERGEMSTVGGHGVEDLPEERCGISKLMQPDDRGGLPEVGVVDARGVHVLREKAAAGSQCRQLQRQRGYGSRFNSVGRQRSPWALPGRPVAGTSTPGDRPAPASVAAKASSRCATLTGSGAAQTGGRAHHAARHLWVKRLDAIVVLVAPRQHRRPRRAADRRVHPERREVGSPARKSPASETNMRTPSCPTRRT